MTFREKYKSFLKWILSSDKRNYFLPVDFSKPWWQIIWDQKWIFFWSSGGFAIQAFARTLLPYVASKSLEYFNIFFVVIFILILSAYVIFYVWTFRWILPFYTRCVKSVQLAANKRFLCVDPLFHSTKSSGKIISKVQRGSEAYENILDYGAFMIVSILSGFITVVFIFSTVNLFFGLGIFLFFLSLSAFTVLVMNWASSTTQEDYLLAEDNIRAIEIENLQQAQFVRSLFATDIQLARVKKKMKKSMIFTQVFWYSGSTTFYTILVSYFFSILVVTYILYLMIKFTNLDKTTAISLIATYIFGTYGILDLGSFSRMLVENINKVKDLFEYVRSFGEQSYPVLEEISENKNL